MEDSKTLRILEDRVKKLESKIASKIPLDSVNISKVKPILNALHEVDTVLISTLSGHDKISALLKKVGILEEICDPSYLQTHFGLDSKLETILASEADLLFLNQGLQRLEQLDSALNKDDIEKLISNLDRLNKLNSSVLQSKEECDKQTAEVKRLVSDYKQSLINLTELFAEVETLIIKLENESPKK
ncbi:hypothetical protein V9T40_009149 [Parthenolecanium corni]|uniref:Dynactin subunit 3 n=1 Tax=Parthenolecanium corni TaxID=536013 RepID=A0AAN9TPG4_9HEMI